MKKKKVLVHGSIDTLTEFLQSPFNAEYQPLALVSEDFDWFFSFSLVLIIGVSTVVQYYFGMTYRLLKKVRKLLFILECFVTFGDMPSPTI